MTVLYQVYHKFIPRISQLNIFPENSSLTKMSIRVIHCINVFNTSKEESMNQSHRSSTSGFYNAPQTVDSMRQAWLKLLSTMSSSQVDQTQFPFEDAHVRTYWHFFPQETWTLVRHKWGTSLEEMNQEQKTLAETLHLLMLNSHCVQRFSGTRIQWRFTMPVSNASKLSVHPVNDERRSQLGLLVSP